MGRSCPEQRKVKYNPCNIPQFFASRYQVYRTFPTTLPVDFHQDRIHTPNSAWSQMELQSSDDKQTTACDGK
jgi:hypothetical protein